MLVQSSRYAFIICHVPRYSNCLFLKILLDVESENGLSDEPGSLMDNVLVGLITELREYLTTHRRMFC